MLDPVPSSESKYAPITVATPPEARGCLRRTWDAIVGLISNICYYLFCCCFCKQNTPVQSGTLVHHHRRVKSQPFNQPSGEVQLSSKRYHTIGPGQKLKPRNPAPPEPRPQSPILPEEVTIPQTKAEILRVIGKDFSSQIPTTNHENWADILSTVYKHVWNTYSDAEWTMGTKDGIPSFMIIVPEVPQADTQKLIRTSYNDLTVLLSNGDKNMVHVLLQMPQKS